MIDYVQLFTVYKYLYLAGSNLVSIAIEAMIQSGADEVSVKYIIYIIYILNIYIILYILYIIILYVSVAS